MQGFSSNIELLGETPAGQAYKPGLRKLQEDR
jgi:hypothetical protein